MEDSSKQNSIGNVETVSIPEHGQLAIKSDSTPFSEFFYFQDFYDEGSVKRFAKSVEKMIRTSREYSDYIEVLRSRCTVLNHDNILHNVGQADADMEFHHYPFTLYDIVTIVMSKHVALSERFTSFSLAKEIMVLHSKNMIGLVPLTKTTHELAHDGQLFISTHQIFGNWRGFYEDYEKYIPNETKIAIQEMENRTTLNVPSDFGGIFK